MSGIRHTPYVCFEGMENMVVYAKPNATTEIPVVIRNLDTHGCPVSTFAVSPGWHPPNRKPWPAASLAVRRTALRERDSNLAINTLELAPGEETLARYCLTLGDVTAPGYVTPVITIQRQGEPGGKPTVNFFEWEGAVIYSGGMLPGDAAVFLYPDRAAPMSKQGVLQIPTDYTTATTCTGMSPAAIVGARTVRDGGVSGEGASDEGGEEGRHAMTMAAVADRAPAERLLDLATVLRGHRYRYGRETELHEALAEVLRRAGYGFEREVRLAPGDRIDLLVGDLGVEVKIKGGPSGVAEQLDRYLTHERVAGLLLVTDRVQLARIAPSLRGKPFRVVTLLGGLR